MNDLKIFIGGQWRRGGGNPMQSHFPADGSINATLNAASLMTGGGGSRRRARLARSRMA